MLVTESLAPDGTRFRVCVTPQRVVAVTFPVTGETQTHWQADNNGMSLFFNPDLFDSLAASVAAAVKRHDKQGVTDVPGL